MTLERLANGTHQFTPPAYADTPRSDPWGRSSTINAPVPPLSPPNYTPVSMFKKPIWPDYEAGSFTATWDDLRGTFQNTGPLDQALHNWKRNDLQGIRPNVACLPFTQASQNAPPGPTVTANPGRMSWANFQSHTYAVMSEFNTGATNQFYEENAATAAWAANAAFVPSGANSNPRVLAAARLAAIDYLLVGYFNGSIDAIADPHGAVGTSIAIPGFTQVYDIFQSPDGKLLVYGDAGGGNVGLFIANNAAPAALVFTLMLPIFGGGYCIGAPALSNYQPGVFWWIPDSAGSVATYVASNNGQDLTPKGHIIRTSFDLLTLEPVEMPGLPWVSIASRFQNGIVACDRKQHFLYTGRGMTPVDWSVDRPADSNKTALCCGHYDMKDRFGWVENVIDLRWVVGNAATHITAYLTKIRWMTYDFYLGKVRQIGLTGDSIWGALSTTVGGAPTLPYSPETAYMHTFNIATAAGAGGSGNWYRIYNPPNNVDPFARRKTSGGSSGTGAVYFGYAVFESSTFWHPSLGQGWEYALVRLVGPSSAQIREGGWDARIDIWPEGYGHGSVEPPPGTEVAPITFRGRETTAEGTIWDAEDLHWTTQPGFYMVAYPGTIDSSGAALTDPTHYTPNVLPLEFHYIVRRRLPKRIKL